MIDWKWLGWALVGSAIASALAVFVVRKVAAPSDIAVAWVTGGVFAVVFLWAAIGKLRYEARWRQYRLTQDYETTVSRSGPDPPDQT